MKGKGGDQIAPQQQTSPKYALWFPNAYKIVLKHRGVHVQIQQVFKKNPSTGFFTRFHRANLESKQSE